MKTHRITGRSLAEGLHVREQTISEWRRGTYRPEGARLKNLAGMLKVSRETLLGDDEPEMALPRMVREAAPIPYGALSGELKGRSLEIEALLGYVLDRQRNLTLALHDAEKPTTASVVALDGARVRDLATGVPMQSEEASTGG